MGETTGSVTGDILITGLAISWVVAVTAVFYRHLRDQIITSDTKLAAMQEAHATEIKEIRAQAAQERHEQHVMLEEARKALMNQTLATASTNAVNAETNKMLVDIVDRMTANGKLPARRSES